MSKPYEVYKQLSEELKDYQWIGWDIDTFLRHYPEADNLMLAVKSVAFNSQLVCGNWEPFSNVVSAFNGDDIASWLLHIEEICYGATQIKKIVHDVHPGQVCIFTGDIPNYIAATGVYFDWTVLPPELSFAQELLQAVSPHKDFTITHEVQNRIDGCAVYNPWILSN